MIINNMTVNFNVSSCEWEADSYGTRVTGTSFMEAVTRCQEAILDGPTYCAYFEDNGHVIFEGRTKGNLLGHLPVGTRTLPENRCGTLSRNDGGDPFERARFVMASGRIVVVELEHGQ